MHGLPIGIDEIVLNAYCKRPINGSRDYVPLTKTLTNNSMSFNTIVDGADF